MIGGGNGSGKTTGLEAIANAFEAMRHILADPPRTVVPQRIVEFFGTSRIHINTIFQSVDEKIKCHIVANVEEAKIKDFRNVFVLDRSLCIRINARTSQNMRRLFNHPRDQSWTSTGVVYLPSDRRDLITIEKKLKLSGMEKPNGEFVHRWIPPIDWEESLEARLINARTVDLNAKEEGIVTHYFEAYNRAFESFFEGKKRLHWQVGRESVKLLVKLKNGTTHELSALSSGEKQVVVMAAELLRFWRPGSLILIDEPELHLHEIFISKLFGLLTTFQRDLGGQIFATTQSGYLFGLGGAGSAVVLGRDLLT